MFITLFGKLLMDITLKIDLFKKFIRMLHQFCFCQCRHNRPLQTEMSQIHVAMAIVYKNSAFQPPRKMGLLRFSLVFSLIFVTNSMKLNYPRVLLPIFEQISVNFTLEVVEKGCFKWYVH